MKRFPPCPPSNVVSSFELVLRKIGHCKGDLIFFLFALKVIQAGMFNQNSTSGERRAFLEALLENDKDDEEVG